MLPIVLATFSMLAAQTLDFEMTPQERKKTGVSKLSEKEKGALQDWIDRHYTKRSEPIQKEMDHQSYLSENLKSGNYIRLANGSLWKIHPKDVPITQGWISAVNILITQSTDSEYPYKLTNSLTGSSVRAQQVNEVDDSKN